MVTDRSGKVVIIGLDGATLDLLRPWASQGDLPNLATYFEEGCYGILRSTIPPVSPQAWASFQTGMNPGKHGIYGFKFLDLNRQGYVLASSVSMSGQPFWRILSNAGHQVTVINLMPSFPPNPVNGFLITDRMTPPGARYTFPPELAKEIETKVGGYIIDIDEGRYLPNREINEVNFLEWAK